MKLSFVMPLYMSSRYLRDIYHLGNKATKGISGNLEWILVNDGSPDDSLEVALDMQRKDKRITVIDLSRNFGHHKALRVGLEQATGEWVFMLDSDLEDRPEWLRVFWNVVQREQADVAFGVRTVRKGGIFEILTGGFFYSLFNLMTGMRMPGNFTTARLMSRRYVDSLLAHKDREMFLGVMMHYVGFKQVPVRVATSSTSPSTYDLTRKLNLFINSMTGYTDRPFRWLGVLGFVMVLVAAVMIGRVFLAGTVNPSVELMFWSMLCVGGILMAAIGMVGVYLYRVMLEVKDRPIAVIRKVYRGRSRGGT